MTHSLTYSKVEPYKTFNYAQLLTRGFSGVLDLMRYERAFFARKTDLELVLTLATNGERLFNSPLAFMLCKYDWNGPTKASWTEDRLQSTMELERINDMQKLYDLQVESPNFRPQTARKIRVDCQITGRLPEIMTMMFMNKAMPASESDAGILEQAFYESDIYPNKELTATLTNFVAVDNTPWIVQQG